MAKLDTLNETLLELQSVILERMHRQQNASEMVIGTVRNILKEIQQIPDITGRKMDVYINALELAIKAYDIATEDEA